MFPRSLLPNIVRHDTQLFEGISEWPESAYGRDSSNHYERRETLRPLTPEEPCLLESTEIDDGPTAYAVKISSDGEVEIISASQL